MPQLKPPDWSKDVILKDGTSLRLRPISPDDDEKMLRLFDRLSPDSIYTRFMTLIKRPSKEAIQRFTHIDFNNEMALVGVVADEMASGIEKIVAVGRYVRLPKPTHAEVAFTVEDTYQGLGIGTHLLQELLPFARMSEIEVLEAEVLAGNRRMLQVFREMGFNITATREGGEVHIEFPFETTDLTEERRWVREQAAHVAALERIFHPKSIAVVGASERPGTIGYALFRNLLHQEFNGPIYPVHPTYKVVASVPCYPSVMDIPEKIDLVLIAVPAEGVMGVLNECATKHVYAVVVISAGFGETGSVGKALQEQLVEKAQSHGIRMVGPNCLGLLNTDPNVRLNATFAPQFPPAGRIAFSSQSGALGIAILNLACELRIGLSQFISVGNKADISGNDLLYYWGRDPQTNAILLYMESFGNPKKFSRIARQVSRQKPILVLKSGSSKAGARAAESHTGALASSPEVTRVLFEQAGIIQARTLEGLFNTAKVLSTQPLPLGRRVAILSNAGGAGILTADRAEAEGLTVSLLSESVQEALRVHLPVTASVTNPVDMIASANAEQYEACLNILLASPEVDQVVVLFIPPMITELSEVVQAILRAHRSARPTKPLVVSLMGEMASSKAVEPLEVESIPTFRFPEDAVVALARLTRYGEWRAEPPGRNIVFPNTDRNQADGIILPLAGEDTEQPPVWLPPLEAYRLLDCYGVPTLPTRIAAGADEAAAIARELGFPVAMKLANRSMAEKTEHKGVSLGLQSAETVRIAYDDLQESLEKTDSPGGNEAVLLQPMAGGGLETVMAMHFDPQFGPVFMFGLGGAFVELFQDVQFSLHPMTDQDVIKMVDRLKSRKFFDGYRGAPPLDLEAVHETILRVSQMIENHPQIREIYMNPVLVKPKGQGCVVADVRIRVAALDRFTEYVISHLTD